MAVTLVKVDLMSMKRKYLTFDIETAKILPPGVTDLLAHRPLGVCCAATMAAGQNEPQLFYSKEANGNPSPQMRKEDLSILVDFLVNQTKDGYTIVTFNGLGFDFNVLAEESDRLDECRQLALNHVDMMFQVFCCKGFGIGLDAVAKGIGLSKSTDMNGLMAPQLWKQGHQQRVLDYVALDCRITMEVAVATESEGVIRWINKRGTLARLDLPQGWLLVKDAMKLPVPDTSWMDHPWPRWKFTKWLG